MLYLINAGLSIASAWLFFKTSGLHHFKTLLEISKNTANILKSNLEDDEKQVLLLNNSKKQFLTSIIVLLQTLLICSPFISFYLYFEEQFTTLDITLQSLFSIIIIYLYVRILKPI